MRVFLVALSVAACTAGRGSGDPAATPDAGEPAPAPRCHPMELGDDFGLPWVSVCGQPCGQSFVAFDDPAQSERRYEYTSEWPVKVTASDESGNTSVSVMYDVDSSGVPTVRHQGPGQFPMAWSSLGVLDSMSAVGGWLFHYVREAGRLVRIETKYDGALTDRTTIAYENGLPSSIETDTHADGRIDLRVTMSKETGWDAVKLVTDEIGVGTRTSYVVFRPDGLIDRREDEFLQGHLDPRMYRNPSGALISSVSTFHYSGCK